MLNPYILLTTLTEQPNAWRRYFDAIDWSKIIDAIVSTVVEIVLFTVLFLVINAIGKRLINHGFNAYQARTGVSSTRATTMHALSKNVLGYTVFFFYLYAVLTVLGVPVGTLLAGAGVVGIALGLGAQGFVADVVTGFFILLEGQIDVGDAVTLGTITGVVTSVGLRTTIVRSYDGTVNYIPNRNITIVSNLSRSNMLALVKLPMRPEADLKHVRTVIDQVNTDLVPQIKAIRQGPDVLGLTDNGDGTFSYQVKFLTANGEQLNVQRRFLAAYVKALHDAGIDLPTPPLNLRQS
ncbi:MAG: mechanosensitive ion channel family protein [Lactobacillus sp.]|uniref:Mechanosensitive ion channel family protein n=1 Tax=Lacticaseibacillus suilingensis TaxID=2799577 RepID=A0ABW4BIZ4_9LACO|nr:mechanosensitive ion channel family protein [Lacticaseibacillus suilingensis]MCI1893755.1 mechanosensitive ion channel family protein [Lactobacillus sp.]MCI1916695.1 mechanosensitive ion channel family protein [Lactobacillus sp.]MCI1941390.1 mechanosensitive ion channel family protein [Lactobacillus sp.]MCI1971935.1 mechanosensitive ion channel family protein [Lactobacillus sp.]MCI2017680.1 mechanosensitive ion channel family protein [Lactobacillus sp.]